MQKFSLKRMMAWLLTFVMLFSIVPANVQAALIDEVVDDIIAYHLSKGDIVSAAGAGINATTYALGNTEEVTETGTGDSAETDTVVDAAIFFSDLHTSEYDYKESTVKGIMQGIKDNAGVSFSSVTSCGDAFSMNSSTYNNAKTSKITGYIRNVFPDIPVNYVWSDHDRYVYLEDDMSMLDNDSGFIYGAGEDQILGTADDGNYYIFELSMADLSTNNRYEADFHTDSEVTANIAAFTSEAAKLHKDRPLFIASHQPLLDRRNDNGHAYEWCNAINEVAEKMDVAFFFGHNHKYDVEADYYYGKGSTMSVCSDSSGNAKDVVLNFTHMCTGYMAPASTSSTSTTTRQGVAVAVTIYEDSINYKTYNSSGVYTGSYALNATVDRDHAVETITEWDNTEQVSVQVTAAALTGLTVTNVYGNPDLSDTFSDYMSVKVEPAGVEANADIKYSIQIHDEIPVDSVVLYHVADDGTKTAIDYTLTTSESGGNYLNFTTKLTGIFAYGLIQIPEGYTLSKIDVTNILKTEYFVGEYVDMVNPVVTATYVKEGEADFLRIIYMADDYAVEDGYTVSGYNKDAAGTQTVTITYQNCTDTFVVNVWAKEVSKTEFGVSIETGVTEYGVVGASVKESQNTYVDSAIAHAFAEGNYVAYDIKLVYASGYRANDELKTVTIPIPANVTRPVVFYVSDDGKTVENMNAVDNGNGTVSFTTTHFSAYVVGQGSIAEDMTGSATTGGTAYEDKTVYVKVTSIEDGSKYLIVNTANTYALNNNNGKESASAVSLTSGTVTVGGTAYNNYIQNPASTAVWTAAKSGNGFTFANGEQYLRARSASGWDSGDMISSTSSEWSYKESKLSSGSYYVRYDNAWSNSTDTTSKVNLYKQVPAQIPTSTQVTYTMKAEDVEYVIGTTAPTLTFGLMANGSAATTLPSGDEYVFTEYNDTNNIITNISENGTITFTGNAGSCYVKVAYTWTENSTAYTAYKYVTIKAVEPYYVLEITHGTNDAVVQQTQVVKDVSANSTYDFNAKLLLNGTTEETMVASKLTWQSDKPGIATVDSNGNVTFTGAEGTVHITAVYEYAEGISVTDVVTISVSKDSYIVPEDGTDDFPEYPNEGSVRYDKTAVSVGNFSETGIAKLELSMTGVPYTTENKLDVVLMLDRSSSMYKSGVQHRISSTVEATKAFIESIVKNEDGTFNNNRILVLDFLGGNLDSSQGGGSSHKFQSNQYTTNEDNGYQIINSQTELDALLNKVETDFKGQTSLYGTEYAQGLKLCYDALKASEADDNQQFCVFMSDGIPNYMRGEKTLFEKTADIVATFDVTNRTAANGTATRNATKYEYEYYSTLMKNEGVTVYTVGLGLQNTNSAWSGTSKEVCEQVANILLNDISGPAGEKESDRDTGNVVSKLGEYFFSVADANAAADMKNIFKAIAQKILDAATDVRVTDKVSDEYTMVFESPNDVVTEGLTGTGYEDGFYIEVTDYVLNPVTDADGNITNYTRGTGTSKFKMYLGQNIDNSYYAASDAAGTRFAAPVFSKQPIGTMFYWTTVENNASGVSVTSNNGTTYYFVAEGISSENDVFNADVWFNIVSGAYADGTPTTETYTVYSDEGDETRTSTTCQNLIIATPYFVYNASTQMLVWTVDKLSSTEIVLTYFLYLNKSGGYSGSPDETKPGPYVTNDEAKLYYTNFNDNKCEQIFPVPQMSWNGAQVSYVFYLVNEAGQPVNRAGRVVPFSEAVYVTDVNTYSIVWNKLEQTAGLEAERLANVLVPDVYELYDNAASYKIHVYENQDAVNLNNHFVIGGAITDSGTRTNSKTTIVFNTKADEDKYSVYGTYAAGTQYKCKEYANVTATQTSVDEAGNPVYTYTYTGNKTQFQKNGSAIYGMDDNGAYTIVSMTGANVVHTGFDFSNTTVAFAVIWKPQLEADVVVIDYGVDVVIDVTTNDALASGVVGVRAAPPQNVAMGHGTFRADKLKVVDIIVNNQIIGQAFVQSLTSVRFALNTENGMRFSNKITFYYESDVNYYDSDNALNTTSMYSSVTIIPATTVYYEESFVMFKDADINLEDTETPNFRPVTSLGNSDSGAGIWILDDDDVVNNNKTQDQDRPGPSQISVSLDHDNVYGYDGINSTATKYSLGTAAKVMVNNTLQSSPYAKFTFTGTGFDIISLTNSQSGLMMVKVYAAGADITDKEVTAVKQQFVNNYYGYSITEGTDGKLTPTPVSGEQYPYQVPVMKIANLPYGTYDAYIIISYSALFDQDKDNSYSFWLDSIRVYDPAGLDPTDATIKDAYIKDNEYNPRYVTIRDGLVKAGTVISGATATSGTLFIDGNAAITQIKANSTVPSFEDQGPNNEVYLAANQGVAFTISTDFEPASAQIGAKLAFGTTGNLVVGLGDAVSKTITLGTATDMYYDLDVKWSDPVDGKWTSSAVTLKNNAGSVISLTNLKVTEKSTASTPASDQNTGSRSVGSAEVELQVDSGTIDSANMVYKTLRSQQVFTPEFFEYKLTGSKNSKYLIAITSADVDSIMVDGEPMTNLSKNGMIQLIINTARDFADSLGIDIKTDDYYVWRKKVASAAEYTITAENAEGVKAASIMIDSNGEQILAESGEGISGFVFRSFGQIRQVMEELAEAVFEPEYLESVITTREDERREAVVTTSEDVEYIIVDGEIVNKYITETVINLATEETVVNRVFVAEVENETAEVTAYNEEGVQSSSEDADK